MEIFCGVFSLPSTTIFTHLFIFQLPLITFLDIFHSIQIEIFRVGEVSDKLTVLDSCHGDVMLSASCAGMMNLYCMSYIGSCDIIAGLQLFVFAGVFLCRFLKMNFVVTVRANNLAYLTLPRLKPWNSCFNHHSAGYEDTQPVSYTVSTS